jgi:hypothetical protein
MAEAATASIRELPPRERPLSEQFRLVALQYADADAAASLLEETKSATVSHLIGQLIAGDPKLSEARAERTVKGSAQWREYVETMCASRARANRLRLQLEYIRIKVSEWQSHEANSRHEARLSR